MSHDPNAQFDQAVLEMIEHSPIGAVPVTPTYQDALARLYASHQIYAHADHRDGHVTARSLARLPCYRANNLEALVAGQLGEGALESNASIFDRYTGSLTARLRAEAASYRDKVLGRPVLHRAKHVGTERLPVAHDLMHTLFLVPGAGPHPGLPGNYLYGSVLQEGAEGVPGPWAVNLHDRDDGAALFMAPDMKEALAKLQEVLECAPFNMGELEALGFRLV
ncbi:MAG TPA: hypothetical protein VN775_13730 [Opitutaceae bacterium]|nr:hypothetical protein [Opitutaceae bacterium]